MKHWLLTEISPDEKVKIKRISSIRSFVFGVYNQLNKEFENMANREADNYVPSSKETYFYDNFYYIRKTINEILFKFDGSITMPSVKRGQYYIPVSFIDAYHIIQNNELSENSILKLSEKKKYSSNESERFTDFLKFAAIICIYENLSKGENTSLYFELLRKIADLRSDKISETLSYAHKLLNNKEVYINSDSITRYQYRSLLEREAKDKSVDAQIFINCNPDFFEMLTDKLTKKARYDIRSCIYFIFLYLLTILPIIFLCFIIKNAFPLILILPMYYFAKEIMNSLFLKAVKPQYTPRFRSEYIESEPTCLIMPVLLKEGIGDKIYQKLEKAYLRNRCGKIYFGALCDFYESAYKHNTDDEKLCNEVKIAVDKLNEKYGRRFFGLVRERIYSDTQDDYIGRERKRGAITDAFRYISTGENIFINSFGNISDIRKCKYACVIDFDTEITANSITGLLSVINHPANKTYGIIVPRLSNITDKSHSTIFNEIISEYSGIDGYLRPIANIVNEISGHGIFSGKGIINIDEYLKKAVDLPYERILSHDFTEGSILNTNSASDIVFYEEQPMTYHAYKKRAHRWIRGDWQSTILLFSDRLTSLDKYILLDNLAESLSGIVYLFALILSSFVSPVMLCAALIMMIMRIDFPLRNELYNRVLTGIDSLMSVKCFSGIFPPIKLKIYNILLHLIDIPYIAANNADAILRAVFRQYISKKKLLEWTTSADTDKKSSEVKEYIVPEIISVFSFFAFLSGGIFFNNYIYILPGILSVVWIIAPLILDYTSKRKYLNEDRKVYDSIEILYSYANDMWKYFADNLTEEYNYLIPDNLQEDPPIGIAQRTSPTNIGFSVLCTADAYILGIITQTECERIITRILDTVDSLPKYKGHLFNWYDIKTKSPLPPTYVSFVDSGNFSCCLITASGIVSNDKLKMRLIKSAHLADFSFLFDKNKLQFHIGYSTKDKTLSKNYYDILASESRLSIFLLISEGVVPVETWQALSRIPVKDKGHYGLCSWSGTVFEFFMPEIFLKTSKGSMLNESLFFAVKAQKERCANKPFGISESCYYSFSSDYAYKYKAMGVQKTGLRNRLNKDFTVSPYSSFLMMDTAFTECLNNLKQLEYDKMTGMYGFYEAIDYKADSKPVKCYMAHHIGMSFTMLSNIIADDINRKSFEKNPNINAYKYLLDEAITPYVVKSRKLLYHISEEQKGNDKFYYPDSSEPKGTVFSNGKYSALILDNGIGFSRYCDFNISKYRKNFYDYPCGVYLFALINGNTVPLNYSQDNNRSISVCIKRDEMICKRVFAGIEIETTAKVLRDYNSEIRSVSIKNSTDKQIDLTLFAYLEPVLSYQNREEAHPSYNALMIEAKKSLSESAVIFTKRDDKNKSISICCGFTDCKSEYETVKDRLLPYGCSITEADASDLSFNGVLDACINPVFCQKTKVIVNKNSKKEIKFIISAGFNKKEAEAEYKSSKKPSDNFAKTNINGIVSNMLPKLLFNTSLKFSDVFTDGNKTLLWKYGISGDRSMLVVYCDKTSDTAMYIDIYAYLYYSGIKTDLIFIADDFDYDKPIYNSIYTALMAHDFQSCINNGVYLIPASDKQVCNYLDNTAELILFNGKEKKQNSVYRKILRLPKPDTKSSFIKNGYLAGFDATTAPYCNILTNGSFGTVISQNSLGFTYAFNAGLFKLTRWSNDPVCDNRCEMLYLRINGNYYDIIRSSVAYYFENYAEYKTEIENVSITTTVYIASNINAKVIDLSVDNRSFKNVEAVYSTDPLLNENMNDSLSHINMIKDNDVIFLSNPTNLSYPSACAYIYGNNATKLSVNNGRAEIRQTLKHGKDNLRFVLGCEKDSDAARKSAKTTPIMCNYTNPCNLNTGLKDFDNFVNTFLYKQIRDSRLNARAGFYQVSGAYGFRDQLQDAICVSTVDSHILKNQIVRCCKHQFIEGDVMHWWHETDEDISTHKGVRTKCSDDMLWLPYAVAEYVKKTGDFDFLKTEIAYLYAAELTDEERDRYLNAQKSDVSGTILNHCLKAFSRSYRVGEHGLLLFGTGDWNDGFSNVGAKGRGESVWLSMFYCFVFNEFQFILKQINDTNSLKLLKENMEKLICAVETDGWDGKYFLRGYYDNGNPLGSHLCNECKIDIMPQIFACLAGSFDKERCKTALNSVDEILVDRKNGIVKLFDIPFSNGKECPGYIKNYVSGVRENGGQYTHAAAFYAYALFKLNDIDKGFEILCLLNPALKSDAKIYRNEPYVLSGDVYSATGFEGRGGWSWYTGSAGWYFKTITEEMLGVKIIDGNITIVPKLPSFMNRIYFKLNVNDTILNAELIRTGKYKMSENDKEIPYIKSDDKEHNITVLF